MKLLKSTVKIKHWIPYLKEGREMLLLRLHLWWWQQTWGWRHRRSYPMLPWIRGCHRSTGRSSLPDQTRDGTCSVAQLAATYLWSEKNPAANKTRSTVSVSFSVLCSFYYFRSKAGIPEGKKLWFQCQWSCLLILSDFIFYAESTLLTVQANA